MIEDGYPIIEESKWKAVPGAQAGALILDYPIKERPKYWACHCLQCGNPYVEKRIDNCCCPSIFQFTSTCTQWTQRKSEVR